MSEANAIAKLTASLPQSAEQRRKKLLRTLPNGDSIDDLSDEDLRRELKRLKVPGSNAEDYRKFLQEKWDDAGETAILLWHLDQDEDSGDSGDEKDDEE